MDDVVVVQNAAAVHQDDGNVVGTPFLTDFVKTWYPEQSDS